MYLSIALSAEGSTDEIFLWPVIYRTAFSIAVDATVQEQSFLLCRSSAGNERRAHEICEHSRGADLFVLHADATRSARRGIMENIVSPIRQEAERLCRLAGDRVVPLITVREMEAWALACPDTIATAVGFARWPVTVPVPFNADDTEAIDDPKRALKNAFSALGRLPRGEELYDALGIIGEKVPFDRLRRLSSFRLFEEELNSGISYLSGMRRPYRSTE